MRILLRWAIILPQIIVVCITDEILDRVFPSRRPGALCIDLNRCRAWIEKPKTSRDAEADHKM